MGYAENWAAYVRANPESYIMATEAHHALGDISRDEPDYAFRDSEDDENYYGAWVTGFGYINVRFPKATSRPLTDAEVEWLAQRPTVIV